MVEMFRKEGVEKFGTEFYSHYSSEPTFWEFVQGIVRGGINDRHWNPAYLHCNLCHIKYDFILKLETLAEDEEEMFEILNLSHILNHEVRNR